MQLRPFWRPMCPQPPPMQPFHLFCAAGRAHWEVLLRARAIETQCYVIAAAQAGQHNEKRESYGHSLIINPWGEVVGRLADPLATGIAVAEIDLERLQDIRARMPVAQHRQLGRPALLGPGCEIPQQQQ